MFQPDTLVILHLPALADGSLDSNLNSPPILYVIQEGINCLPTTDYFFTNVKPALIIVTCPVAHQNKPTSQQAATGDPISQQTHPSQPDKTRVYPSMLTNKLQGATSRNSVGWFVLLFSVLLLLLQLCQRFLLLWLCSNVLQLLGNVVRVYPRIVQGLMFLSA